MLQGAYPTVLTGDDLVKLESAKTVVWDASAYHF